MDWPRAWLDRSGQGSQGFQDRLEIGLSTLEDECATQGLDWEEVLEQRAREQTKMQELGLSMSDLKHSPSNRRKPMSNAMKFWKHAAGEPRDH